MLRTDVGAGEQVQLVRRERQHVAVTVHLHRDELGDLAVGLADRDNRSALTGDLAGAAQQPHPRMLPGLHEGAQPAQLVIGQPSGHGQAGQWLIHTPPHPLPLIPADAPDLRAGASASAAATPRFGDSPSPESPVPCWPSHNQAPT